MPVQNVRRRGFFFFLYFNFFSAFFFVSAQMDGVFAAAAAALAFPSSWAKTDYAEGGLRACLSDTFPKYFSAVKEPNGDCVN